MDLGPRLKTFQISRPQCSGSIRTIPEDFANQGRDELEAALDAAGVTNQFNIYPGTKHAFNNDTAGSYNEEQSLAAWADATGWMDQYVKGGS
jgi:dienelactone hydrolase